MDEFQKKIKEFTPYLEDLFRRIYFLTLFFITFFIAGFFLSASIIKILTKVFNFRDVVLATTSPFQLVDLAMSTGLLFGVVLCVPIFIYHLYGFIGSGLNKGEKKTFLFMLPLSLILFLIGFVYCFSILYLTIQVLANINISLGIQNLWDVGMFLYQIIFTSALLGLIFQFPIVITLLVKFNLCSVEYLRSKRRYAIFGMFVFTSLLPPTDGISLLMMVIPLIVMYEMTIVYNVYGKKRVIGADYELIN